MTSERSFQIVVYAPANCRYRDEAPAVLMNMPNPSGGRLWAPPGVATSRMRRFKSRAANHMPYTNLRSKLLYEMNDKSALGARQSAKMDFSRPRRDQRRTAERHSLGGRPEEPGGICTIAKTFAE